MNRTIRDGLTLAVIAWIGNFIFALNNPTKTNFRDQNPVTVSLIGIAYCIGRRRDS